MNRDEARAVLATVKAAYPNTFKDMTKRVAEAMIKLWMRQFKGVKIDLVEKAVDEHIATSKFAPSISEIKLLIIGEAIPEMAETAGQAWIKSLNMASKWGRNRFEDAKKEMTSVAAEAARSTGWEAICNSGPNDGTLRAHFLKIYEDVKLQARQGMATGKQYIQIDNGQIKQIESGNENKH